MRHQVSGRKLGRKTAHRLAMLSNMSASLIKYGRIKTTIQKAKELRSVADRLVTLGKENTLHAKRRAFDMLRNRDAVVKLFAEIAPAFAERHGGYTRIYHTGHRVGDAAKMAIIEYLQDDLLSAKVTGQVVDKKEKKKPVKKAAVKKEAKAAAPKPKRTVAKKSTPAVKKQMTKRKTGE